MEKKAINRKVALINTPILAGVAHHPLFPPIGLAYLAAVLEQNNFEVRVMDCPVCEIDHEKLKADLASFEPTLIGVGSMTPTIESAFKSARVAKEACPDAKVVIGGPHATFMDRETLAEEPATDIVVRGEGEETLLEIVQQLPNLPQLEDDKGRSA